jgi:hypothetical protein
VSVYWNPDGLASSSKTWLGSSSKLKAAGSMVVRVTDTGAGLSSENLAKLFSEGVQFHANELQAGGGSGLGLWISKGIVDMHDGQLSATSPGEGLGSVFTLELPVGMLVHSEATGDNVCDLESGQNSRKRRRVQVSHSDARVHPRAVENKWEHTDRVSISSDVSVLGPPVVGAILKLNNIDEVEVFQVKTVLVVDDSKMSRKVLCRLLVAAGYICHEACDGQDAIDKYEELKASGCGGCDSDGLRDASDEGS